MKKAEVTRARAPYRERVGGRVSTSRTDPSWHREWTPGTDSQGKAGASPPPPRALSSQGHEAHAGQEYVIVHVLPMCPAVHL